MSIEEKTSCLYRGQHSRKHWKCKVSGLHDELDVSDLLLLLTESDTTTSILPIPEEELYVKQAKKSFCQNVISSFSPERQTARHDKPRWSFLSIRRRPWTTDDAKILSAASSAVKSLQCDDNKSRWPTSLLLSSRVILLAHHVNGLLCRSEKLCYMFQEKFSALQKPEDDKPVPRDSSTGFRAHWHPWTTAEELPWYHFLLVILDKYSELVCSVPLRNDSAATAAKVLFTHWVLLYGLSSFFFGFCRITVNGLRPTSSNRFVRTWELKICSQELIVRSSTVQLKTHMDYPSSAAPLHCRSSKKLGVLQWNLNLCFQYSKAPREPVRALWIDALPYPAAADCGTRADKETLRKWNALSTLLQRVGKMFVGANRSGNAQGARQVPMQLQQERGSSDPTDQALITGFRLQGILWSKWEKHKVPSIAEEPFHLVSLSSNTVLIQHGGRKERKSRDRVVEAPNPV